MYTRYCQGEGCSEYLPRDLNDIVPILLGYLCWPLSDHSRLPRNDVVTAVHQRYSSQTRPA